MNTPILTMIFFVKQVLDMMNAAPFDLQKVPSCIEINRIVLSQLEFLHSFIADLIDLRQLKVGAFSLEPKPFSLVGLLKSINAIFKPQVSLKGIQFRIIVALKNLNRIDDRSQVVPRLIGDERRLKQVIMNLIRNAIKFT